MKKHLLTLAMLISVAASAQSTVQITPVSATYTTTPTIQFKVSWTNQLTANHRNKVWIFVDFQSVISPTQKEYWQPATITGTVQKTAGTVSEQSNRGFFLEGTTTNFSSTVTVQLGNANAPFNWCAYASDCPPNIGDYNNGTYTLRGSPPFTLKDANGATQTVPDKTIAQSALEITPVTMTDATGCPGYFCKYIVRDLYIDATHKCDLRTSGAQNWEAWIKDTRDNELYRIVLMPDNIWWLAQNLKYATDGNLLSGCDKDSCGMFYNGLAKYNGNSTTNQQMNCPDRWVVPSRTQWEALTSSLNPVLTTAWQYMRSKQVPCNPKNDAYGWATKGRSCMLTEPTDGDCWMGTFETGIEWKCLDQGNAPNLSCNPTSYWYAAGGGTAQGMAIRCLHPE